jgi:hypothetical protein
MNVGGRGLVVSRLLYRVYFEGAALPGHSKVRTPP